MIILEGRFVVQGLLKRTSAEFFKELKIGDEIRLWTKISNLTGGRAGYKAAVRMERISEPKLVSESSKSISQLANILEYVLLQPLENN